MIKKYKKDVETCFNNLINYTIRNKELIFFNKHNNITKYETYNINNKIILLDDDIFKNVKLKLINDENHKSITIKPKIIIINLINKKDRTIDLFLQDDPKNNLKNYFTDKIENKRFYSIIYEVMKDDDAMLYGVKKDIKKINDDKSVRYENYDFENEMKNDLFINFDNDFEEHFKIMSNINFISKKKYNSIRFFPNDKTLPFKKKQLIIKIEKIFKLFDKKITSLYDLKINFVYHYLQENFFYSNILDETLETIKIMMSNDIQVIEIIDDNIFIDIKDNPFFKYKLFNLNNNNEIFLIERFILNYDYRLDNYDINNDFFKKDFLYLNQVLNNLMINKNDGVKKKLNIEEIILLSFFVKYYKYDFTLFNNIILIDDNKDYLESLICYSYYYLYEIERITDDNKDKVIELKKYIENYKDNSVKDDATEIKKRIVKKKKNNKKKKKTTLRFSHTEEKGREKNNTLRFSTMENSDESDELSDNISEELSNNLSEKLSNNLSEELSNNLSEELSNNLSEELSNNLSDLSEDLESIKSNDLESDDLESDDNSETRYINKYKIIFSFKVKNEEIPYLKNKINDLIYNNKKYNNYLNDNNIKMIKIIRGVHYDKSKHEKSKHITIQEITNEHFNTLRPLKHIYLDNNDNFISITEIKTFLL